MSFYLKIIVCLLFLLPATASVYGASPIENKPAIPYEVLTMKQDILTKQVYLGNLVGDPHTYEFSLGEEKELVVNLSQLENEPIIPFSIILIKVNDNNRGVKEMGRLSFADNVWSEYDDPVLGLNFLAGKTFNLKLGAGIYRLEVSTPENQGKYLMVVGQADAEDGYFASLGQIRVVQKFFDHSIFKMLSSSFVYYPLGILAVLGLFFLTWRNRERLRRVTAK